MRRHTGPSSMTLSRCCDTSHAPHNAVLNTSALAHATERPLATFSVLIVSLLKNSKISRASQSLLSIIYIFYIDNMKSTCESNYRFSQCDHGTSCAFERSMYRAHPSRVRVILRYPEFNMAIVLLRARNSNAQLQNHPSRLVTYGLATVARRDAAAVMGTQVVQQYEHRLPVGVHKLTMR